MITLYLNPYMDSSPRRQAELDACLKSNLDNPKIDRVVLLIGGVFQPPEHPKVTTAKTRERATYADFFNVINDDIERMGETSEAKPNRHISIIANTDIFFDDTVALISQALKGSQAYALSRWNVNSDGTADLFNQSDSQDVWCFRGVVRPVPDCHFQLGVPGCDNAIAERLERAGYELVNPSVSVRGYHLHVSNERAYQAPKPYKFVKPSSL